MCVFIADVDGLGSRKLENQIEDLAPKADIRKFSVFHCNKAEALNEIQEEHWLMMQMAFVSLDFPNAMTVGDTLYHKNPACRLIYYRNGNAYVNPLLPTRPVWYWDSSDSAALREIFEMQMKAMKKDPYFFYYSDRMRSMAVPYESILYVYSLKRAVYLHTQNGDIGPLPKNLDEIQKKLPKERFTRVHQSFLVKNESVRSLNKTQKLLTLSDGSEVPVSRALYDQARAIFCQNVHLDDQNDEIADKSSDDVLPLRQEGTKR